MTATEHDDAIDVGQPLAPPKPRPDGTGPDVGRLLFGAVLILIGALWTAERAGLTDLNATAVLAIATITVGLMVVVRSRDGDHPGLVTFGIVLAVVTAVTAGAPLEGFQGGVGDRTITVGDTAELDGDYELAAGSLMLDLRQLDWDGTLDPITIDVGLGEATILVPPGAAVDVRARVAGGQVNVRERSRDGVFIEEHYRSPGYGASDQRVQIEANVFLGTVEVDDE